MLNLKNISLLVVASTIVISFQIFSDDSSTEKPTLDSSSKSEEATSTISLHTTNKATISTQPNRAKTAQPKIPSNQLSASLNPIDRIKAIQEKTALHNAIIQDHNTFSRYPAYNQRITSVEQDPIEKRYEIDERTTHSEEGDSSLTLWSDKKFYLHGDEVTVFATLQDADGMPIATHFMGQLIYNETQSLQTVEFADPDGDGIYEYHLTLDNSEKQTFEAGIYKVLVINDSNELADAATFTLSQPDIILTGNYKDSISSQGDLLIETEVEVTEKHRFYFQAALYSSTNDPIGATQHSIELPPGRHWIPLPIDGLVINDAGEPGPYLLKSISFARVAMPIQRAPIVYPDFYTKNYSVDQFRNEHYATEDSLPSM